MLNRDILLTTFPGHKSRNVGDNLISRSAIELVRSRFPAYDPDIVFREHSLDGYNPKDVRSIMAPGFSVSNDTYPTLFSLYSDLSKLHSFFPVGCSFQHPIPTQESFDNYTFNASTLKVLSHISALCGRIPCRDQLIEGLLSRHGIPAVYCGDVALFDQTVIDTIFTPPSEINSLVFTICNNPIRFGKQSEALLLLISERFPDAKKYVAHHSRPVTASAEISDFAENLGFSKLHLYGDAVNLASYDSIDLHVGYRLHGHISFLRRRKPSLLFIEDARAFGFANSGSFATGCFEALSADNERGVRSEAPLAAMEFLDDEIKREFASYSSVFDSIDDIYKNVLSPRFDEFCSLFADR